MPPLTRVMVLAAWVSLGTALAVVALPAPERAIACLLAGAAALLGLRTPGPAAALGAVLFAALLAGVVATLAVSRMDPAAPLDGPLALLLSPVLREPAAWAPALAGAALVLGAASLGAWAASGLAGGGPTGVSRPPAGPSVSLEPLVASRVAGLRRLEAEIAVAAAHLDCVSVALVAVDGAGGRDGAEAMRRVDETIVGGLTPGDGVSEHGPGERLLVLPGVSAPALRAGAAQLCTEAAERSGRPVHAALVTFPVDGMTPAGLLDRLDAGIGACRAAPGLGFPADSQPRPRSA